MDEAKRDEIRQWLLKADHDLGSAKLLAGGATAYPDTAVYHCQQAAEKALKAFLTLQDEIFPKTHDLSALLDRCVALEPTLETLRDMAEILTPYATAFRYPGPLLEPSPDEVIEAIAAAELVLKDIRGHMPSAVE
jgi:HEPN domain-containing protein